MDGSIFDFITPDDKAGTVGVEAPRDYPETDLFGQHLETWRDHWRGMPEFVQEDLTPHRTLNVVLRTDDDVKDFTRVVGQSITPNTKSIWYPEAEIGRFADKRYVTDPKSARDVTPRYPIYVISKGRWKTPLTSRSLTEMGVPHQVVVEERERPGYEVALEGSHATLLTLDPRFQEEYDTLDDFGDALPRGAGPARNFVWEHALASGAERHWILDDNIDGFYRLNYNLKVPAKTPAIFRAAEDFTDRYENVAQSGFHYFMFASRKTKLPPLTLNTRVYSCMLLKNDLPYRWRGRTNEDTDLSIRMLKDRWCTILFSAFLAFKCTTMTMRGGNTDEIYRRGEDFDGRLEMSRILERQHPDVAKIAWKWGRWHHQVDYQPFRRNLLEQKVGIVIPDQVDDYAMALEVGGVIRPTEEALGTPR